MFQQILFYQGDKQMGINKPQEIVYNNLGATQDTEVGCVNVCICLAGQWCPSVNGSGYHFCVLRTEQGNGDS